MKTNDTFTTLGDILRPEITNPDSIADIAVQNEATKPRTPKEHFDAKRFRECYEAMQKRIDENMEAQSVFNCFKIFFREELIKLELNSEIVL